MGAGSSAAACCTPSDRLPADGGVEDLFASWADEETGTLCFDSSAFEFPLSSVLSPSSLLSTAPAPTAASSDIDGGHWPLLSSTASLATTPSTIAPSTTPSSLLSTLSTPLLSLDPACLGPGFSDTPLTSQPSQTSQSLFQNDTASAAAAASLDWDAVLDMPAATDAASTSTKSTMSTMTCADAPVPGLSLADSGLMPVVCGNKAVPAYTKASRAQNAGDGGRRADADTELLLKRQRNSLAARKYRQKKLDRISELEAEVSELQEERDALRIKLARQEAETAALREMLLVRDRAGDDGGSAKRRKRK